MHVYSKRCKERWHELIRLILLLVTWSQQFILQFKGCSIHFKFLILIGQEVLIEAAVNLYWEGGISEFPVRNTTWSRISDWESRQILTNPGFKIQNGGTMPEQQAQVLVYTVVLHCWLFLSRWINQSYFQKCPSFSCGHSDTVVWCAKHHIMCCFEVVLLTNGFSR